ncbi:MAG: undecaprenyl-diphosphate phosphatase [Planctomycetota bacterium]|jgi:undecaprenyl-diphosphatase
MSDLDYFSAVILGLVQGITEFLPVSSSGHLALFEHLNLVKSNSASPPLSFDLLLHLATVLIVLNSFYSKIKDVFKNERIVLFYVTAATIPAALCGMFFREYITDLRNSPVAVCIALICTAVSLYMCEQVNMTTIPLKNLRLKNSVSIGICQAFALVPGVSRSGLTITGGVMSGLSRSDAVKFSFFMMIPIVAGAFAAEFLSNPEAFTSIPIGPSIAGFISALISGTIALKLLTLVVLKNKLKYFAAYCAIAGTGGIIYFSIL